VSLAQWLAGRGNYLLESHAPKRAQARQLARCRCGWRKLREIRRSQQPGI